MSTSHQLKRLWTEYEKLQNWASSADLATTKFKVEHSSMDESTTKCPSESTTSGAASNTQNDFVSIFGSIYPSTEPFKPHALNIEIQVPVAYPQVPPKVYMKTNIRHPNIEKDGRICSALLEVNKTWNRVPLADVVKIVINLIENPETGYVVDAEMGSLYDSDINKYNQKIKEMITHGNVPRT